ncbi:XRE family transcriptional regulator [Pseudoflavonifractor sp. 524-17]|uniref:helix-turn-helix domain-containing protein n=1 Tax=Pseudoflavonifractor sp. 524-17 TaxID=2304577 RepID=UPI00137A391B|nr:helix-turn-helix transcriptional regulator [Pseudoflavonifractor sp. 524-17]NCE63769.1 XRE family transcriptional regulator [Pseudoflavonifractor sp. 524-17]
MSAPFFERLKELRTQMGVSQKRVAEAAGVTMRMYQRYEYGECEPTLSILIRLADFYGVSIDELAGRRKSAPPEME